MSRSFITDTIQRALASAGLDPQAASLKRVTDTIQQALGQAGIDLPATLHPTHDHPTHRNNASPASAERPPPGSFTTHSFSNPAGTRTYRLYVPASLTGREGMPPLVVMLHGCKQNPDDFAAGTRMNALAEQHGFVVVYPGQAANANGSNCWNWFQVGDQARDAGEPAILAGLVQEVIAAQRIDPKRVFVAGLSAGAAMSVILGRTHPELFAAVGVHSGLPYGAAYDVASAFGAMNGNGHMFTQRPVAAPSVEKAPPTIVFHGDQDRTVVVANGQAVVDQALAQAEVSGCGALTALVQELPGATCTLYADANGRAQVEHWVVHGAGHAWSGGSPAGSFTDASGPDASAEMLRFFLLQGA